MASSELTAANLKSSDSQKQLRSVPRYMFVAATELTDSASATRLSGRVTEISRKGCYVDILNVASGGKLAQRTHFA